MARGKSTKPVPRALLKPPPAFPDMRIGLLGGSFNPAHEGHLHISRMALRRLGLDRLWWLVTPGNPLKPRRGLKPLPERLKAAMAMARHPRIDVTAFEAAQPTAYTADTLDFLLGRYPGTLFVWVMGADNLAGFHHWRRWREIAGMVPLAVLDRPGFRFAALAGRAAQALARRREDESDAAGLACLPPPAWTLLTMPLTTASSSAIRAGRRSLRPQARKKRARR